MEGQQDGAISREDFQRLLEAVAESLRLLRANAERLAALEASLDRPGVSFHHATIHHQTIHAPLPEKPRRLPHVADPTAESRDAWIYQQCCAGIAYKAIQAELRRVAKEKGWRPIGTLQGIIQAAHRYARRHDKPLPPPRQET